IPNDPGASANDPDFSPVPEYFPAQEINAFYNPLKLNDGPFYSWAGTVSTLSAATNFYTAIVNGFQPWVTVEVVGSSTGNAIAHPQTGTYVLSGGGPHIKAFVDAGTSPLR